jgi:altronate hydrolase
LSLRALRIHPEDDVAVALVRLPAGSSVAFDESARTVVEDIPAGHKFAWRAIRAGEPVLKYGQPIGRALEDIRPGAWVHTHNLASALGERTAPAFRRSAVQPPGTPGAGPWFDGFLRADGLVGTRNEIWIIPAVGCVNSAARRIAEIARADAASLPPDGVQAFEHPFGCSQLGDDLQKTRRVLAALIRHPNAGGVLVLGLGCENNRLADLIEAAGPADPARLRYFNAQEAEDEIEAGVAAVRQLALTARADRRVRRPVSDLVIGLKCGGSDGFSGLTANPIVGRVADRLVGRGGGVLQTEVPEMFGAERSLMDRAADETVFRRIVGLIDGFKGYFLGQNQPIDENPSPGNREGGLTTLEEKSLGAVQKSGQSPVRRVLANGERAPGPGLALVEAPGNDGVSSTALTAAGAAVILFTTGRGTPYGAPVPTVKISSRTELFRRKPGWIDFDAGGVLEGAESMAAAADRLFEHLLDVASGRTRTKNETNGARAIDIWKGGVTL